MARACRGFFRKISARDRKFFIRRPARLIRKIRTRRGRILAGDLGESFLALKMEENDYAVKAREPECFRELLFTAYVRALAIII